jgi:oligopeptide transport system substrate-binding protein
VSISDDRKTYTFHLRQACWSDGSPVTAFDFEQSWKQVLSPSFPAFTAHLLYPIKNAEAAKRGEIPIDLVGIKAIDAQTLQIELKNPTPYFLDLCANSVFYPIKFNDQADFITNGPFRITSWKRNDEIVFTKNPAYWEADCIFLDQIQISFVAEENTVLHMFDNGELDLVNHRISPIPSEALKRYEGEGSLHVRPCAGSTFVSFNTQKYPFNNKNIRKAFALAINRQGIVDYIIPLSGEVATSFIPPLLTDAQQAPFIKDNTISEAQGYFQQGLIELGINAAQFPKVTYNYSPTSNSQKIAQALQQQWEQNLGVSVVLQNHEHKVLLDKLSSRNYDFAQSLYIAYYHDPMSILERFKYRSNLKNYPGWENQEFISLLDQSFVDPTPQQRKQTLLAAEALFADEMPLTVIFHWKTPYLAQKNVKDAHLLSAIGDNLGRLKLTEVCP